MLRSPPSFFGDVSRHGLGAAFSKRFSSFTVGGRSYSYDNLRQLPWEHQSWILEQAAGEGSTQAACWAFEAMLVASQGNFHYCIVVALQIGSRLPEERALPMLEKLLAYTTDFEALKQLQMPAQGNYLLGKVYSNMAVRAKGRNKTELQSKKALALHHLGVARDQVGQERVQPTSDPYRQAAMAAGLAAAVAATYEVAAYLQYKGTRTTALAE